MNTQLLAHMETFDSDEEYSESPELWNNYYYEDETLLDPIDTVRIQTKTKIRKFVKPKNVNDILQKLLTFIPIVIALTQYIGFFWSFLLSVTVYIMLQLRPTTKSTPLREVVANERRESTSTHHKMKRRGSSLSTNGRSNHQRRPRRRSSLSTSIHWERSNNSKQSNGGHVDHARQTITVERNAATILDLYEKTKKQVHDCRKGISRLLGLVGASPLQWTAITTGGQSHTMKPLQSNINNDQFDDNDVYDVSLAEDVIISNVISSTTPLKDSAINRLVKFVEGHVQFILSVDHAYYWIKTSSSLHWGLGPQSQCVERVERAMITKHKYHCQQQEQHQSINEGRTSTSLVSTDNNIHNNSILPLKLQRKVDTSSILALSSCRRNLAQCLIDQSESLVNTYRHIMNTMQDNQQQDQEQFECSHQYKHDNGGNQFQTTTTTIFDDGILTMPDVIDLAWIKASRRHVATLLSVSVAFYCSIDCLQELSSEQQNWKLLKLEESAYNIESTREYLLCNLLLDKTRISARTIEEKGDDKNNMNTINDRLLLSLLQYRQHVDALNAAIWSCQQYSQYRNHQNQNEHTSAGILQQDKEFEKTTESSRLKWWSHVKELSSVCYALEHEIETQFFPVSQDDSSNDTDTLELDSIIRHDSSKQKHESGHYEDGQMSQPSNSDSNTHVNSTITKTVVFAGKGAVTKEVFTGDGQTIIIDSVLPIRDTVAEQLLVKELQNRINTLIQPEEEMQVNSPQENTIVTETVSNENDVDDENKECTENNAAARPLYFDDVSENGCNESHSLEPDREATSSLFLGATGSLLNELKQNISSVNDNDIVFEKYIAFSGDDRTEDTTFEEDE